MEKREGDLVVVELSKILIEIGNFLGFFCVLLLITWLRNKNKINKIIYYILWALSISIFLK